MLSTIMSFIAIIIVLQPLGSEALAQEKVPSHNHLLIQDAQVSANHRLNINGQNFGTSMPTVNLDGVHILVCSSSPAQIVVQFPSGLLPGRYLITVSAGASSSEFDGFYIKILPGGVVEPEAVGSTPGASELRLQGLKEYRMGNLVGAQRLLETGLALAVQSNDEYLVVLIQGALGDLYQNRFDFSKAEQAYAKAVVILRQQPEHASALAVMLRNMGAALSGERRFPEAASFYAEAAKIIKDNAINDPDLEMQILNGSGVVYFHQGDSKKAMQYFVRALQIKPFGSAPAPDVADTLSNLATVYALNKNYPMATDLYTQAIKLVESRLGPSHPDLTPLLDNLGFMYNTMRRYEEAEDQFRRSLTILEHTGMMRTEQAFRALHGLSETYMGKNQGERAETLLAQAIDIGRSTELRTTEMADTFELYSKLLRNVSKTPEAETMHREAARIRSELLWTTRVGGVN